jgi:hypothetical protein
MIDTSPHATSFLQTKLLLPQLLLPLLSKLPSELRKKQLSPEFTCPLG